VGLFLSLALTLLIGMTLAVWSLPVNTSGGICARGGWLGALLPPAPGLQARAGEVRPPVLVLLAQLAQVGMDGIGWPYIGGALPSFLGTSGGR